MRRQLLLLTLLAFALAVPSSTSAQPVDRHSRSCTTGDVTTPRLTRSVPQAWRKAEEKDRGRSLRTSVSDCIAHSAASLSTRSTRTFESQAGERLVEELYQVWEGGQWMPEWRQVYTYDASGNLVTYVEQGWDYWDGSWENDYRRMYAYDAQGKRSQEITQSWEEGQWLNDSRTTFTYNSKGAVALEVESYWEEGQWDVRYRDTYTYNSRDSLAAILSEQLQGWGEWTIDGRTLYTYDANGYRSERLWQAYWDGQWSNRYRYLYTHDANGNMTSETSQDWEDVWINNWRDLWEYDASGKLAGIENQSWDGGQWRSTDRATITTDESGNIIGALWQEWNGRRWVDESRFSASYDESGNWIEAIIQEWDGAQWVNELRYTATYGTTTASEPLPGTFALSLDTAPNPVTATGTIRFSLNTPASVRLALYDLLGREVALIAEDLRAAGTHAAALKADQLPAGLYLLRLEADGQAGSRKITVVR